MDSKSGSDFRSWQGGSDTLDLQRILANASRCSEQEFGRILHENREEVLRRARDLSIHPMRADVVLREFCPEINLEEQYQARLAELDACKVIHLDEQGRPSITAIDGHEYPIPTLEEIRERLTLEKIHLISTLPEPRIMLLVPFGMPLKELAKKVTMIPGNIPGGQPGVSSNYDLDADLPDRTEVQEKMIYDPQRFDPQNHGGKSKKEILKDPSRVWDIVFVDGRTRTNVEDKVKENATEIIDQVMQGRVNHRDLYKDLHDLLKEYRKKGWTGFRPEDALVLHSHATSRGVPFDHVTFMWHPASYLPDFKRQRNGAVSFSSWEGVLTPGQGLKLNADEPDNSYAAGGGWRGAVRL